MPVVSGPKGSALAESALSTDGAVTGAAQFDAWFAGRRDRHGFTVRSVPLGALDHWHFAPDTGDLRHDSGHFFTVQGLRVHRGEESWDQPIMSQREIGVLGFLTADFDGLPHVLVQAKMEPGNVNIVHLAPSVQATRSNLAAVHQGRGPHHAEHFVAPPSDRVLVDSLQSERGAWFLRKRNRHLVVSVDPGRVAEHEDFCWLTLGQLRRLLLRDNLVTMEAASVLSCLALPVPPECAGDDYGAALLRSQDPDARTVLSMPQVLSRIIEVKAGLQVRQQTIPLNEVRGWCRDDLSIRRPDGRFFEFVGTEVQAPSREVAQWTQPLLRPAEGGISALVTRVVDGVLHVLLHARSEAGLIDVAELAPTVQCTPSNYAGQPGPRPRFLDEVLATPPERIRYDTLISEEGARFHRAESRYLIVEVTEDLDAPEEFVWVSLAQVGELLTHSYLLNMQARTLMAALHALW